MSTDSTTTFIVFIEVRKVVDVPEKPGRYAGDAPVQKASKDKSTLSRVNVVGDELEETLERAKLHMSLIKDSKGGIDDGKVTR